MAGSIVEGNMLLAFGHLLCFDMLGVVGSSLKIMMIKFFMLDVILVWPGSCSNVAPSLAQ